MRTTKRFTPHVLDRFRRLGRGEGTYSDYIPWHRVSRSDPSSRGRSHLLRFRGRHVELLSDGELIVFAFSCRLLKANDDAREQFPLSLDRSFHELTAYDVRVGTQRYPGTLEIAQQLETKHPMVRGDGESAPWVMTTDLLLTLRASDESPTLLAISCKPKEPLTERSRALLDIERAYWLVRGVPWLLITPDQYHPLVAATLHRTWHWALENPVGEPELQAAEDSLLRSDGHSLTNLLGHLSETLGDVTLAQHAVWQVIWSGRVTVDLRRGWRPHLPLRRLPQADFDQLNPVLMRRSAWI